MEHEILLKEQRTLSIMKIERNFRIAAFFCILFIIYFGFWSEEIDIELRHANFTGQIPAEIMDFVKHHESEIEVKDNFIWDLKVDVSDL